MGLQIQESSSLLYGACYLALFAAGCPTKLVDRPSLEAFVGSMKPSNQVQSETIFANRPSICSYSWIP